MKKIVVVAKRNGKNFGFGFSIPETMDEIEMVKNVLDGYEIVILNVK